MTSFPYTHAIELSFAPGFTGLKSPRRFHYSLHTCPFCVSSGMGWLALIVVLAQPRSTKEGSLSEERPGPGWPMGMSLWGVILVALIDVGRPSVKVGGTIPWFGPWTICYM